MTSSSLLVVCGLTLTGSGQRPSEPKPVADDYLRLVELYVSGDVDSAVAAVRTWQVDTIRRLQATSWDRAVLRAAAMLETDAALLIAREAADQFPPYAVPARAQQPVAFRIGLAEGWLKAADASKPQDKSTFRGRWYAAVGRSLLGDTFLGLADSLLFDGCTLFPRDSEMLLACGTAREAAALHYSVNPAIALEQSDSPSYTRSERSQTIDTARTILQRVVNLLPDSAEARVRLAHLHVTEGKDRAAAPLLAQARQLSPPTQLGYVAALLFGDIAARRGELRDAIESYDQAKRLVPGTESAYLAHAFALRSAGNTAAAGVVLREMLARDRHAADPWTGYLLGLDDPAARLDVLRAEVRRERLEVPKFRGSEVPRFYGSEVPLEPPNRGTLEPRNFGTSEPRNPQPSPLIVDVLVTRSNVPVTGLSAADFELRDSGVIQRVEVIDGQSMPIDLKLAVDVSQAHLDSAGVAELMDAVNAVATDRAPADRIEVLRFGSHIRSGDAKDERGPPAKRRSRLVDAAFTSLALPELPDARRLVLLFSDGKDSSSWLSPAAAVRTARESRATVYAVTIPQLNAAFRSPRLNLERLHNWLMDDPRSFREGFLPVLINETGGELLNAASAADLRATFLDALSRFRQRYLLKYFPEPRPPPGWRELNVRVPDKTMTVIVRRGVQQ